MASREPRDGVSAENIYQKPPLGQRSFPRAKRLNLRHMLVLDSPLVRLADSVWFLRLGGIFYAQYGLAAVAGLHHAKEVLQFRVFFRREGKTVKA